jgi:hypothetical protein
VVDNVLTSEMVGMAAVASAADDAEAYINKPEQGIMAAGKSHENPMLVWTF